MRMKEYKLEQQKIHQEERVKKALERAQAPPRTYVGKKPVFRSEPPLHTKRIDENANKVTKEEEELAYFFT